MPEELPFFLALERRMWEALKAGDASPAQALLAEDFLGVYESGLSSKTQYVSRLASGPFVAHYQVEAKRLQRLTPTVVLLTYRATWREATQAARNCYITSVWEKRGPAQWVNTFSQDTELRAATATAAP